MDFTSAINFRDESFDAVMMTEVLEHLPYPSITVREVHRLLKKKPGSAYVGSAPLDYHLHRRWKVLRGKRLSGEQTHVHHFSFKELDKLLRFYFEKVDYLPLSGTAARHPKLESFLQSVCAGYRLGRVGPEAECRTLGGYRERSDLVFAPFAALRTVASARRPCR